MTSCVGLLRGVNVGKARRVPMAELRDLVESLGFDSVRTLLNSGNVVFDAPQPAVAGLAGALERAIATRFGFEAPVVVITRRELDAVVSENPLVELAGDPSRLLVAFFSSPTARARAQELLDTAWAPDALALGRHAAYLWCEAGLIESRLSQAFARATGPASTSRNWATVLKLQALAAQTSPAA
jgi:uncharacterized protein (DUF1697 family)